MKKRNDMFFIISLPVKANSVGDQIADTSYNFIERISCFVFSSSFFALLCLNLFAKFVILISFKFCP